MPTHVVSHATTFSNISTANFLRAAFCAYGSNDFIATASQIIACDTIPTVYKLDSIVPHGMTLDQLRYFIISCLVATRPQFMDHKNLRYLLATMIDKFRRDKRALNKSKMPEQRKLAKDNIRLLIDEMKTHKRYSLVYNLLDARRCAFQLCVAATEDSYYYASQKVLSQVTYGKKYIAPLMTLDAVLEQVRLILNDSADDIDAVELPIIPPPAWMRGLRRVYDK